MAKRSLTIIAVRHGETEWNLIGKSQHLLDSALTPRGKAQIHRVGKYLAHRYSGKIHVIYTSKLGRAISSAKIIAGYLNTSVVSQRELNEQRSESDRETDAQQWLSKLARQDNCQGICLVVGHGDWIATLANLAAPPQQIKTPNNGEIIKLRIEL